MTDAEIEGLLRATFTHGAVERDGEVVGMWYVHGANLRPGADDRAWATALWRTPKGVWNAQSMHADDVSRVTVGEGDAHGRGRWGSALLELHAISHEGGTERTGSDLVRNMIRDLNGYFGRIEWGHAKRIVDGVLTDVQARARDTFGMLDQRALGLLLRHKGHVWTLGDGWHLMDGTDPARPLATALERHPGLPATVCAVVREMGGEGFAREAATPRGLDALLVRRLRADVPDRLLPAVAHAERALAHLAEAQGRRSESRRSGGDADWRDERLFNRRTGDRDWPVQLVLDASRLPASWMPRDDAQWVAYLGAHHVIETLRAMRRESGDDESPGLDRILNVGGDWVAWVARLHAVTGTDDGDGLVRALANVGDVARAYERQVLLPVSCAATRARGGRVRPRDPEDDDDSLSLAAHRILFGGRTLARAFEVSAAWHRRQARMAAAIASMPGAIDDRREWAAGLPDAEVEGIELVVLRSGRALVDEGARGPDRDGMEGLDNCVAGYGEQCRSGRSRVVSLRRVLPDGSRERLSVAEVQTWDDALRVTQHVGRGNGPPPRGCERVLERYLDQVRNRVLPWEPVFAVPGEHATLNDVERAGGYDPYVEGTRSAVQDLWAPFVPRPLRRVDEAILRATCRWDDRQPWPVDLRIDDLLAGAAKVREEVVERERDREASGDHAHDPDDMLDMPF